MRNVTSMYNTGTNISLKLIEVNVDNLILFKILVLSISIVPDLHFCGEQNLLTSGKSIMHSIVGTTMKKVKN